MVDSDHQCHGREGNVEKCAYLKAPRFSINTIKNIILLPASKSLRRWNSFYFYQSKNKQKHLKTMRSIRWLYYWRKENQGKGFPFRGTRYEHTPHIKPPRLCSYHVRLTTVGDQGTWRPIRCRAPQVFQGLETTPDPLVFYISSHSNRGLRTTLDLNLLPPSNEQTSYIPGLLVWNLGEVYQQG